MAYLVGVLFVSLVTTLIVIESLLDKLLHQSYSRGYNNAINEILQRPEIKWADILEIAALESDMSNYFLNNQNSVINTYLMEFQYHILPQQGQSLNYQWNSNRWAVIFINAR